MSELGLLRSASPHDVLFKSNHSIELRVAEGHHGRRWLLRFAPSAPCHGTAGTAWGITELKGSDFNVRIHRDNIQQLEQDSSIVRLGEVQHVVSERIYE